MSMVTRLCVCLKTAFANAPEQANQQVKVIKRQRKFTAVTLAWSHILACLKDPRAKFGDIAEMALLLGVDVTAQAVQQRYTNDLPEFFAALFKIMAKIRFGSDKTLAKILDKFTEAIYRDSTTMPLPASLAPQFPGCGGVGETNVAAIKVQTELDIRTGQLNCVQLEAGKSPDQATELLKVTPQRGSLQVNDLGYFSIAYLKFIIAAGAYFISRIQHTVLVHEGEQSMTVIEYLRSRKSKLVDTVIEIGKHTTCKCRMIAWRVPAEIANRRRRALKKRNAKKSRQPTKRALEACDWNVLTTNATSEMLSVEEVIVLYRARWQIELLFKRWKTLCGIELLDGRTDAVTMTRFWARLCAALVQQWLVAYVCWTNAKAVPSFFKVAKAIRQISCMLALSIHNHRHLKRCLERFKASAAKLYHRTKRRKNPSFIELLRNPSSLDYVLT